jgi:hypothetical protein
MNAGNSFLTTEQQKVSFLIARGVSLETLPAKAYGSRDRAPSIRRFVDRFPMFIVPQEMVRRARSVSPTSTPAFKPLRPL